MVNYELDRFWIVLYQVLIVLNIEDVMRLEDINKKEIIHLKVLIVIN